MKSKSESLLSTISQSIITDLVNLIVTIVDLFILNTNFWNESLVRQLFVDTDDVTILSIHIQSSLHSNKIRWIVDPKGFFSLKFVHCLIRFTLCDLVDPSADLEWKAFWAIALQDRLRLVLWKIARNVLPCRMNVACTICQDMEIGCLHCNHVEETLEHLFFFFYCSVAQILWRLSPWPLNVNNLGPKPIGEWIKLILNFVVGLVLPCNLV